MTTTHGLSNGLPIAPGVSQLVIRVKKCRNPDPILPFYTTPCHHVGGATVKKLRSPGPILSFCTTPCHHVEGAGVKKLRNPGPFISGYRMPPRWDAHVNTGGVIGGGVNGDYQQPMPHSSIPPLAAVWKRRTLTRVV